LGEEKEKSHFYSRQGGEGNTAIQGCLKNKGEDVVETGFCCAKRVGKVCNLPFHVKGGGKRRCIESQASRVRKGKRKIQRIKPVEKDRLSPLHSGRRREEKRRNVEGSVGGGGGKKKKESSRAQKGSLVLKRNVLRCWKSHN